MTFIPRRAHCCRAQPHPQCTCDDLIKEWCKPSLHQRVCLDAPQHLPRNFSVRSALANRRVRESEACKWDDVEVLLKASIYRDELDMLQVWVLSWLDAMDECFPRLHVVSDVPEHNASFRGVFRSLPNVTFHTLRYPFAMETFYSIQWPMVWADNFTTARHVLILDADTPLVLPLRCHHLFDAEELPVWRSWATGLRWTWVSDEIFARLADLGAPSRLSGSEQAAPKSQGLQRAHRQAKERVQSLLRRPRPADSLRVLNVPGKLRTLPRDFMSFFPVVIPRAVLRPLRELLGAACAAGLLDDARTSHADGAEAFAGMQRGRDLRKAGACADFDRVWLAIGRPSYADLLGRVAMLLRPAPAIRALHCPPLARMPGYESCEHFVPVAEHLKHPHQRPTVGGMLRHMPHRAAAAAYGASLRERAVAFARGQAPIPPELFYYPRNRSSAVLESVAARRLRPDSPRRVCGRPREGAASRGRRDGPAATTAQAAQQQSPKHNHKRRGPLYGLLRSKIARSK